MFIGDRTFYVEFFLSVGGALVTLPIVPAFVELSAKFDCIVCFLAVSATTPKLDNLAIPSDG